MNSVVGAVIAIVAGLLAVVAILLVNGGYAYRSQCPLPGGSVETSWSYRISSIIPYSGYSRSNCGVHSATRVAFDKIGIWRIGDVRVNTTTVDHTSEWTDIELTKGRVRCVANGGTYAFCSCAITELARRFTPREAALISAKRLDQLPGNLGRRARRGVAAIDHDCR